MVIDTIRQVIDTVIIRSNFFLEITLLFYEGFGIRISGKNGYYTDYGRSWTNDKTSTVSWTPLSICNHLVLFFSSFRVTYPYYPILVILLNLYLITPLNVTPIFLCWCTYVMNLLHRTVVDYTFSGLRVSLCLSYIESSLYITDFGTPKY